MLQTVLRFVFLKKKKKLRSKFYVGISRKSITFLAFNLFIASSKHELINLKCFQSGSVSFKQILVPKHAIWWIVINSYSPIFAFSSDPLFTSSNLQENYPYVLILQILVTYNVVSHLEIHFNRLMTWLNSWKSILVVTKFCCLRQVIPLANNDSTSYKYMHSFFIISMWTCSF